jgi:hypothetical protein
MVKIKLLQNDSLAYEIRGAKGETHEVAPELAARMISSGHAVLIKPETATDPEPDKTKKPGRPAK